MNVHMALHVAGGRIPLVHVSRVSVLLECASLPPEVIKMTEMLK